MKTQKLILAILVLGVVLIIIGFSTVKSIKAKDINESRTELSNNV